MILKDDSIKIEIADAISKLWTSLTEKQQQALFEHMSVYQFKKNEIIYENLE